MQRRNFRNRNDLSHTKPQKMLMMMTQWTLMGIMLLQQIKTIDSAKFKGDSCVSKNEPGICKEWSECPIIKTLIESGQYTNREVVSCGFGIKEELICCPVRADPSPDTTTVKTEDRSNDPSTIMATTQAPERDFWLDLLENTTTTTTTEKPDFWLDLLTTTTPTATTTTTTIKPLVVGDQRLNESSEFFDFNALLGGNQSGGAKQERQTNSESATPNNILTNPGFVSHNGNGNGNLNTGPVNFNQWNLRQPTNNFNSFPGLPNNNGRGNNGPNNIHFGWGSPNNGRVPFNGPPNFNRGQTMGRGPSPNGRGRGSQNNWRGRNGNNGIGNQNRGFMFPENSEGPINFFGNGEPLNRRPGRPVNNIEEQNPNNSNNNNKDDDKIDELIKDLFGNPNEANINSQTSTALDQEKPRELALEDSLANIFNIDKPLNPSAQQPVHWLAPQNSNNNKRNHGVEYVRHYGPRHQIVFTNPQAAGQFHTMPSVENPISNNDLNLAPSTSFIQQPVVVETWSASPVLTPNGFNPVQEVYQNLVNSGMDIVQAQPDQIQPSHVVFVQHQQQSPQFVQQPDVIYQPQSLDHTQQMESLDKEHSSTLPLQQFVRQTNGGAPVQNLQSPPSQILDPFKPFEFRPPLGDENNLIEDNNSLSTNTNLPTPDVKTNAERPAVRACRRIESGLTAALTPHIIGGVPAEMEEFPHMVAIGYSRIGGDNRPPYDIRCGGTLIDKRYVLTAAHCVSEVENVPSIVRLGLVNLTDPDQMRNAEELRIKEIFIHDDYFSRFTYNDIAILELEREVVFSKNIYPVCLYTDEKDPGPKVKLWVTGWGTVNITTRSFSNILLKAPLHISPLENCNKSFAEYAQYGSNRKIPDGIIRTQLCAEDKDQTKDACQGDSGGPLILVEDESYKNYRLVGVVSTGVSCASPTPGLYTRVAAFLDFIEKIVWPNGGE